MTKTSTKPSAKASTKEIATPESKAVFAALVKRTTKAKPEAVPAAKLGAVAPDGKTRVSKTLNDAASALMGLISASERAKGAVSASANKIVNDTQFATWKPRAIFEHLNALGYDVGGMEKSEKAGRYYASPYFQQIQIAVGVRNLASPDYKPRARAMVRDLSADAENPNAVEKSGATGKAVKLGATTVAYSAADIGKAGAAMMQVKPSEAEQIKAIVALVRSFTLVSEQQNALLESAIEAINA